ncbi:MAG: NAD+ kinase [Armatimonadetes bacterium]|nr:NAD+ kinase [Armatimonadota bacterium]
MQPDKIVVVTRKTRLDGLVERFATAAQARFYIDHSGGDFADYQREHDCYQAALERLRRALDLGLKLQLLDRSLVPTYLFGPRDLVVTLGQDGLVANTAKYVGELPLIAVNPDPERYDGVLLPFRPETVRAAVERVLGAKARERRVTLAEAVTRDGQRLLGFNDLFIGARSHVSARYRMRLADRSESHSSSGVIVSTGAGCTGWLSSLFRMAAGLTRFAGGTPGTPLRLDWETRRLVFVVREPFVSLHSQADLVAGTVEGAGRLELESLMPSGGVVFSDGVESDFIEFNAGCTVSVGLAERQARLVAG